MIQISEIEVEETYPLRIRILRNGEATNYKFDKDQDTNSLHLGAFIESECIGILSIMKNNHDFFSSNNTMQIRGMAVNEVHQKKGVGRLLVEKSYSILEESKYDIVWCNAREEAVQFYQKMGFLIKGKSFSIPNIGIHYVMYKEIG